MAASDWVGDARRTRWDSLRLFTPARFSALPGMPAPAAPNAFPTKDEMADYLEAYTQRFGLPVHLGSRVEALDRDGGQFALTVRAGQPVLTDGSTVEAATVLWCTGYRFDHSWIHLPDVHDGVDDHDAQPAHYRGVATNVPGCTSLACRSSTRSPPR